MLKMLKKLWNKKWLKFSLIGILSLLILGEIFARFALGLGSLPLYKEDKDYEYRMVSNQDLWRFGNHIVTNSFGMRSKKVSKSDKKVLLIGDSVINGGAHIDHDDLASTILDRKIADSQILNISAGSWGPDNAFAFIKKHGDFDCSGIILVFSSHDAFDNMHFKKVVGKHPMWPDEQPFCALTDGWSRYAWPKLKSYFGYEDNSYEYLIDFDDSKFNTGWNDFKVFCQKQQLPLFVYLHPELDERKSKGFNKKGKVLLNWLKDNEINYISGLDHQFNSDDYRDNIHLNSNGQKKLSKILFNELKNKF